MIPRILSTLLIFVLFAETQAQLSFTNATPASGIETTAESWGASWGDVNGDKWPDLFMTNHWRVTVERSQYPIFYINNQDGSFTSWSPEIFETDGHAAAFADPDNDGDQDLLIVTGRGGGNQLLVNDGGLFTDVGGLLFLYDFKSRGRTPVWHDLNSDGMLDAAITYAKPYLPTQQQNVIYGRYRDNFLDVGSYIGYNNSSNGSIGILCDVNGDQFTEIVFVYNKNSVVATDYKGVPDLPIQEDTLFADFEIVELVCGDFNGDLKNDIYCVRNLSFSNVVRQDVDKLDAYLFVNADEQGIAFTVEDSFSIDFRFNINPNFPIYLGEDSVASDTLLHFDFAATDFYGMRPHLPGIDTGIYLGYDSVAGHWEMYFTAPVITKGIYAEISSPGSTVKLAQRFNFDSIPPQLDDAFLMSAASGALTEGIDATGIDPGSGSYSAVAGDFDNDMDLDLYLVCSAGFPNIPNRLFENLGNGSFTEVPLAGGAIGTTEGLGESATTVDFDRDGFLDIFVTNGNGDMFVGPCELWRNEGLSGRNFISLDLEGVESNRDGIGTVVHLYAGGVAQLRENNNGGHRYSQNEARLHFGLGANLAIDSIVLYWPSGIVQRVYNPPVNSFTTIVEGLPGPVNLFTETLTTQTEGSVQVVPNPVRSEARLISTTGVPIDGRLLLYNSKGELELHLEIDPAETTSARLIDFSHLSAGAYYGSVGGHKFSFVKQ